MYTHKVVFSVTWSTFYTCGPLRRPWCMLPPLLTAVECVHIGVVSYGALGTCSLEVSRKKTHKMTFWGRWSLIGQISQFCFKRIQAHTNWVFCVQVSRKSAARKWGQMIRRFGDRKVCECISLLPLCARLSYGTGSFPPDSTVSVHSDFPSYSRKSAFVRPQ